MALRDHSGSIALCASLMLHGVVSYYLLDRTAAELGQQRRWAALPLPETTVRSPILVEEPVPLSRPPVVEETKAVEPKPEPPPPLESPAPKPIEMPELKPVPIPKPELAPEGGMPRPIPLDGFGELSGSADATSMHSLSGDKPMHAPRGEQDQPLIRREPSIRNGDPDGVRAEAEPPKPVEPTPAVDKPEGPKPEVHPEPAIAAVEPPKPEPQLAPAPQQQPPPRSTEASLLLPGPGSDQAKKGEPEFEPAPPPKPVELTMAVQKPVPAQQAVPERPAVETNPVPPKAPVGKTSQLPAGQVAPQSDSDSDAFSTSGSVEFLPGKVKARFGRAVKTVRPKLSLAGRSDVISLWGAKVVMEVRTDETGSVRDVRIAKSSGSTEIDQPTKLAMYQWWFEPPRDASGRPQPSVMTWTIHFSMR